ncbi:MAG: sugar ABC transporter permease [Trueperaceae bacterium]
MIILRRFGRAAYLWAILPSIALVLFLFGYPIFDIVRTSLHEVTRFGAVGEFIGTENFEFLFADPVFIFSLWRTLSWTVVVVAGTILLSLPIAMILNEDFYGRSLARTIVLLPWAISLTMTAIVWRWALNGQYGMLNATLIRLGLSSERTEWLATADLAFPIAIGLGMLVSTPFTVAVLLGGLSSVPRELYDAGRIDGAAGPTIFRFITLPLLAPFLNLAVILNIIYVFNSFPIIWVLTQGGPANSTDILVTYLYKLAFRYGDFGPAAAMSLIMVALLLIFSVFYSWLVTRGEYRG